MLAADSVRAPKGGRLGWGSGANSASRASKSLIIDPKKRRV